MKGKRAWDERLAFGLMLLAGIAVIVGLILEGR